MLESTGTRILWHDIDTQISRDCEVAFEVVRSKHPSFNPVGIEVMGVIKYLCNKLDVTYHEQYPHQLACPSRWPEVKQALKLFPTPHEKDAFVHAIILFNSCNEPCIIPKI